MSVFSKTESEFDYPSSPESVAKSKTFAGRPLQQIAEGDPTIFGNMSSSDALASLENGTYRGLEGIDFGMSFGSPVAKLPNGMILDVSPGTITAAIKTRENKRREILGQVLRDIDREAYAEKNRESFDGLLSGLIEEGGLSESAAAVYRSEYERFPAAVLSSLIGFDRTDRRAVKAAEVTARSVDRDNYIARSRSGTLNYQNSLKSELQAEASGANFSRNDSLGAASRALGNIVDRIGDDAFQDPAFIPNFVSGVAEKVILENKQAMQALRGLQSTLEEGEEIDPSSANVGVLVGVLKEFGAANGTPIPDDFLLQAVSGMLGSDITALSNARASMSREASRRVVESSERDAGFRDRSSVDEIYGGEDGQVNTQAEKIAASAGLFKPVLRKLGRLPAGASDVEIVNIGQGLADFGFPEAQMAFDTLVKLGLVEAPEEGRIGAALSPLKVVEQQPQTTEAETTTEKGGTRRVRIPGAGR